jgi:hypothetical protein
MKRSHHLGEAGANGNVIEMLLKNIGSADMGWIYLAQKDQGTGYIDYNFNPS